MIKAENIQKNYGSFHLSCSIQVPSGCICALVGQNGAGKSTAFKSILNLIQIDGGKIEILGKTPQDFDRQRIGVVLSDSLFSGYLTTRDYLPVLNSLYTHFEKEKFLQMAEQFQLPLNKKIKDFSSGMKAKLKILIAITHQADLLILDEPTAGLDVIARNEVLDMLRTYMSENERRSILISSHISSDLENLCDELYLIENGQILLHETCDVLFNDYALLKLTPAQYEQLDKQYLLRKRKESFGYSVLTNQRQFYAENYPEIVIEKGTIDECIAMMAKGETL